MTGLAAAEPSPQASAAGRWPGARIARLVLGGLALLVLGLHALVHIPLAVLATDIPADWQPLFTTEQFLLHFGLALAVAALVRPRLGPLAVALSVLVAHTAVETGLIDEHGHALLIALGVYGPGENPQYAKMLLYGFAVPPLVLLAWRRPTLDRALVLIATLAVIGTTAAIHLAIVHGSLLDARTERARLATWLLGQDDRLFAEAAAALGFEVWEGPPGAVPAGVPADVARAAASVLAETGPGGATRFVWPLVRVEGGVLAATVAGVAAAPIGTRVLLDGRFWAEGVVRHHVYFAGLTITAHAIWLGGALGLLWFHRTRFARRRDPAGSAHVGMTKPA